MIETDAFLSVSEHVAESLRARICSGEIAPGDRDYTLVLGTVLIYSSLLIVFNICVDIAQALLNPRIRLE